MRPQEDEPAQITKDFRTKEFYTKQIEQPKAAVTNHTDNKELIQLVTLPKSQTIGNISKTSEYTPTRKTIIQVASREQVDLPKEIAARSKSTSAAEQPLSETDVKPPVLDKPGMADELICVNFDQVDIRMVLKTVGDITGINFVLDDSVHGNVTVMFPTKIRLAEVYKVLESILEVKGFAAVPAGRNLVKIVPRADAAKRNLQVRFGNNPSDIPRNDTLITQIIPLNYANAGEISQIIQPLLATGAQMAIYTKTNSIVITDTSSNIHHIAKIIQTLDVKEQITVFSLNYASAQVISEQITRIIEKNRAASSPVGRNRSTPLAPTGIKIIPDPRTNSLYVVANEQDTEIIERLIMQLDVERPDSANNVHVVYLENAQPKEVAESLTAVLANLRITGAVEATQQVQVTADEGTNSVIVAASTQDFKVIAGIIEKLDIVREQVLVELLIMEVSEEGLLEIGIDWATLDEAVEDSIRFFGATNFGPRVDFVSGDLEGLAVGAWRADGSDVRIGAILHALDKESGVNILSTPHITTSNHNKAKIIIGENIPYVVESRITETSDFLTPTVIDSFEYKDVGISLEITPHISQGGLVRLEIDSEFSKLIEGVTGSSVNTPTTAKRQAQTIVSMNSGSTIVIGGLIRDDKVTLEKKIPLLGDLPLLGGLFKYQRDQMQKTNLLMFITPHVMSNQEDLDRITEKKRNETELLDENGETNNNSE
ncbi:MAG: type II secretion system secretin GspD [Aliifodinibius sp.]|nr:type II secretion system secretin GspD [Fodinibius sp.]NIY28423.1 type II secretion system secretin GspD [Fodinibius sp.]